MIKTMNSIAKTQIPVKPAAIWARVSTTSQAETSLPSQISRCKEKLQGIGYSPIYILQSDWASLDLLSCPEFQTLYSIVRNREIKAIAVFDRDRLPANPIERLAFLSDCKDAGIEVIFCQGMPVMGEDEGQLIEMALAIGKKRAVLRAQQGSRDGLHDRATKFHKPVTFHKLYGYKWDKENVKLVPDGSHSNLVLIFHMLLDGAGYTTVIGELAKRRILSPSGQATWNKTTLSAIVHNPAYAGRYFSLKKKAVEPKNRRGETYGHSSVQKLPLNEAHYMPNIEVVDPPIAWEQRGLLLDQLERHQKLASRNAKRDYLLRGRVFCETHRGKNAQPRRYHGRPKRGTFYYACPVGGCDHAYIDGPKLDGLVTANLATLFLSASDEEFYKLFSHDVKALLYGNSEGLVKAELDKLGKDEGRLLTKMAALEDGRLAGRYGGLDTAIYERLKVNYEAQRQSMAKRRDELLRQLSQIGREQQVFHSLKEIREKAADGMWVYFTAYQTKDKANILGYRSLPDVPPDTLRRATNFWRSFFDLIDLQVHIYADDSTNKGLRAFFPDLGINMAIAANIKLPFDEIASTTPGDELRNQQYYPLDLSRPIVAHQGANKLTECMKYG